ncbi:MAG: TetR/AcrR family transcriptional regulator [Spirochaetes bacterium]|nr:TetR/AcrR family transcriptional regulator [Spirochaetota bacterium]
MSSKKDAKMIWLDEGLKILETKGPSMLSIDSLTLRTGKTKGSFYHHFSSREAYIKSLLEYYERISTLEVLDVTGGGASPRTGLKMLTKLTFQLSGGLELAIRAWALYDPMVKRFQDRLDRQRLEHIRGLHAASGMDEDAARTRSYRDYSLYIGLLQLKHHHSDEGFRMLLKSIFSS